MVSEVHSISNSEASALLKCERSHYYAFAMNLEPKQQSTSLSRGNIGHEALAQFYTTGSENEMQGVVDRYLVIAYKEQNDSAKLMLAELKQLLGVYVEFQREDAWEIIAVEKKYSLPVNDEFNFTMRLDLLVKLTRGPRAGEIAIVDHKFVYDFYNANTLRVNAQIPKYLATVRNSTGLIVTHGILNMLRHRTKKGPMTYAEKFRRESLFPSNKRIRNIMREQLQASERIIERKEMGVEAYGRSALRSLNQMTCNNCGFIDLCLSELEGEDISLAVELNFQPNSYNYNGLAVEDE